MCGGLYNDFTWCKINLQIVVFCNESNELIIKHESVWHEPSLIKKKRCKLC